MSNEQSIPPVSAEALAAFREKQETITEQVAERSLAREQEVAHHGEDAERLIKSGLTFTTRMLDAAMAVGEVSLLEDQMTWAMERLPHDGVVPAHILNRLRIYRRVVRETLPERHASEIEPYLTWMIARMDELLEERS
jgi:hypothetical protein